MLAGQQYEYLLQQMRDALEPRRPNFRLNMHLFERFELADLTGMADYISRQGAERSN